MNLKIKKIKEYLGDINILRTAQFENMREVEKKKILKRQPPKESNKTSMKIKRGKHFKIN
jgi:hypothetical protein